MNIINYNITFILGFPGAGKSTLGKNLALLFNGIHISIGDLIRKHLQQNPDEAKLFEDAFKGDALFSHKWIAEILEEVLSSLNTANLANFIFIDAGPPLHEVIKESLLSPLCILYLDCSEEVCKERFYKRQQDACEYRNDDILELFLKRTRLYRTTLPQMLSSLAKCHLVNKINGDAPIPLVVRQALSSIYFALSCKYNHNGNFHNITQPSIEHIINTIDDITNLAIKESKPYILQTSALSSNELLEQNHALLLLKPPFHYDKSTFNFIAKILRKNGYEIYAIAIWNSQNIIERKILEAHFELHFLIAAYGSAIIPSFVLETLNPRKKNIFNAYEIIQKYNLQELDKLWNESHKRYKISRSFWVAENEDHIILNGHIPSRIYEFHNARNIYAIFFKQSTKHAKSWQWLRHNFLGATDPSTACQGSLRRLAYKKKLNLHGGVSFNNNGFHLSAGPLEAIRELFIWLGPQTCSQYFTPSMEYMQLACDYVKFNYTDKIIHSMFESCENLDFQSSQIMLRFTEKLVR